MLGAQILNEYLLGGALIGGALAKNIVVIMFSL